MNFRDNFQEGSDALMAWLQSMLRDAERARPPARMPYGISLAGSTVDMDYSIDEWNVSLVRITVMPDGKLAVKRFAGPRDEAYSEANDWRDSLKP